MIRDALELARRDPGVALRLVWFGIAIPALAIDGLWFAYGFGFGFPGIDAVFLTLGVELVVLGVVIYWVDWAPARAVEGAT